MLDHEEIRAFWANVETCGLHRLTALALKMVVVTGQRPGEVSGMHEDEISGRWWTIPASRRGKTENTHDVYLTDSAMEIIADAKAEIERLHKRRKEPWSGNIFEARPGKPLTRHAVSRAVARYHIELGAKLVAPWGRWTPHDLRRTMRTGLSACKVRPDIAEIVIGHVIPGIRGVYDKHDFKDDLRAAALAWEARLMAIVDGRDPDAKDSADVIEFEGARA